MGLYLLLLGTVLVVGLVVVGVLGMAFAATRLAVRWLQGPDTSMPSGNQPVLPQVVLEMAANDDHRAGL
jgi:hypothetical protein